jgi:hypothetical protein
MAVLLPTGSELVTVQGLDGTGRPSGVTENFTAVQFTNFEGSAYLAAPQSVTSSTTLVQANFTNATGVTPAAFSLIAGGVYVFELYLSVTNGSAGGLKIAFGGTATAATLSTDTWTYNTTTVAAQSNVTSLASNLVAYTGTVTTVNGNGTIVPATSGTFYLTFAQNVSNATATTLNAGTNFWIDRIV